MTERRRSPYTLAGIVRSNKKEYLKTYRVTSGQRKVLSAIEKCRTAALGGHKEVCESCGEIRISYNSCRNRHCPQCQYLPKEKWIEKRSLDLLPIPYFHVVFTIPDTLYDLFYSNQKVCYNLFFKAVKETLLTIAADEKYLGVKIGFLAVMHTWGQNLLFHPHIHCIVTGGGLTKEGGWKSCPKNYFLPVKVLSALFKRKLLFYLKTAAKKEQIIIDQKLAADMRHLYDKNWVVYSKPPFGSAKHVLAYLGRYTHRVAISNNRIKKITGSAVEFSWRDYKNNNQKKTMSLAPLEFMRRFLLHVLPSRFHKVRAYGLLSNHSRKILMPICRRLLKTPEPKARPKETWQEALLRIVGIDIEYCHNCNRKSMRLVEKLAPTKGRRRPP